MRSRAGARRSGLTSSTAYDDDGTVGVVGAFVADRAEQQTAEASQPTAADDERASIRRGFDQCVRRAVVDETDLDLDVGAVGYVVAGPLDGRVSDRLDVGCPEVGFELTWLVEPRPRRQGDERCTTSCRIGDRPRQRRMTAVRSVDAHDDVGATRRLGRFVDVPTDDRNRTRGVVDTLAAHRAEQQASETAAAAGADDEQVRSLGGVQQRTSRRVGDDDLVESLGGRCSAIDGG